MRTGRPLFLVVAAVLLVAMLAAPLAASASSSHHCGCCTRWYTIRYGDTLAGIAARYHTTVYHLAHINGITNPNHIIAGRAICVGAGWGPGPHHGGFSYVVRWGDTLGNIGWRFGWGALTLARVNGIANPDRIYPGQVLWIPAH
jgi:lysozyme